MLSSTLEARPVTRRKSTRAARGLPSTAALAASSLAALAVVAWHACSTPGLGARLGNPALWAALSSLPVAAAAFPTLAAPLRRVDARWSLAPFALLDLGFCLWLAWGAGESLLGGAWREALTLHLPLLAPNAVCAVHVLWRVVLVPRAG